MTTISKRFMLAGAAVVLVVVALVWATPSGSGRYLAESSVIPNLYTNAFFARTFERQVIEAIPGVIRLRAVPKLSAIPGSGMPVRTNGVVLRIVAAGPTAQDAQRAANEAATRICQIVLANYGATGEITDQASSARRYSYFNDRFQPAIARLFHH